MIIDDVHRGIQKNKARKRVGRGPGSGQGKTAGRGHKGYYSRRGASRRVGFSGGQMPLARIIAKRGFNNNQFADKVLAINVSVLDAKFQNGETVNPTTLAERGLAKGNFDYIKVLGDGDLTKKLTVQVHRISRSAQEKIQKAGGTVETLS